MRRKSYVSGAELTQFLSIWLCSDTSWAEGDFAPEGVLTRRGYALVDNPADADVVVAGALPLPAAAQRAVDAGAGLVLLVGRSVDTADVTDGVAVVRALTDARRGVVADPPELRTAGLLAQAGPTPAPVGEDLLARVDLDALQPLAALSVTGPASSFIRLPGSSRTPGASVGATSTLGAARLVVLAVAIDASSGDLFFNAVTHTARAVPGKRRSTTVAVAEHPAWLDLKAAVGALRPLQAKDGSIPERTAAAVPLVQRIVSAVEELAPLFPHDADYLTATVKDLTRWADGDFGIPDFLDSLQAFHPERDRTDGRRHLVLFPMYTQNGNPDRNVEAVLIEVLWPDFIADLEAGDYSNKLFVPIRFLDFTAGYDTNSAVLFPETVAMREVPSFSWGAIFADREAARFRKVVTAAADITRLALPPDAARLLVDQELAEQTFVMWDLIHDRTHMHGDLPFDPFMIKQRMPYFLYTLEELRCDLTAFRESVRLERDGVPQARLVQYAILFDRIFRFAITGSRVRNYDGLGGQLLFAWLHQHHVLHWTDNRLTIDWAEVTEPVLELGRRIERLYWESIDRSKTAHWLAAYQLVSGTVAPHPLSTWAKGPDALPLDGPPKGLTDAVLPDEFPLSMFYEALNRKLSPVVTDTAGITG